MTRLFIHETGFECKGHAGYGTKGKDIVCAGISTLAQAAAFTIAAHDPNAEITIDDGLVECLFDVPVDSYTKGVLDMLEIGANAIEAKYPSYMKVTCTQR